MSKTLTEFDGFRLKAALNTKKELTAAGKTAEELPAAMGEALKLEGDKLALFLSALELAEDRADHLKRVVVYSVEEGKPAPKGAVQKGDKFFLAEFFFTQQPARKKFEGRRDGKGGKGKGRRGGKGRGGRDRDRKPREGAPAGAEAAGGPGGEKSDKPRGPRGPRPPRREHKPAAPKGPPNVKPNVIPNPAPAAAPAETKSESKPETA